MECTLTAKEFQKKYNTSEIQDFFKNKFHYINSHFDFYEFYGIEESLIREIDIEADIRSPYRIPAGASDLLALMIKCCNNARGYDERKHNAEKVNYDTYSAFIKSVDEVIDEPTFPGYQRAFIKLHRGYKTAKVFSELIPKMIELFSVMMLSTFRLGQYSKAINTIKDVCVSLDHDLCKNITGAWLNTPLVYSGASGSDLNSYDKAEKACEDMKIYPILEGSNLSEIDLGYNAFSLEKVIGLCFRFFSDPNAAVRLSDFYNDDKEYIDDKEHLEEDYINDLFIKKQETVSMENPEDIKTAYESVYKVWEEEISRRIKDFDDKLKKASDSIFPGFMSRDHLYSVAQFEDVLNKLYGNNSSPVHTNAENNGTQAEETDSVRKAVCTFQKANEDTIKRLEDKMNEVIAILLSTT